MHPIRRTCPPLE